MLRAAALIALLAAAAPAAGQETGADPARPALADSLDGNAWTAAWHAAAARSDAAGESHALHRLDALAFWSPPVVALARWTLASAPRDAVLLAQTDGDAAPLRMLQEVHGLRTDVEVVSVAVVGEARAGEIAASWETSARPVVGALTLDPGVLGAHAPALVLAGAYQRPGRADELPFDLTAAEATADLARGADFVGPRVSAQDRDPARRASPVDLGGIVLFNLLQTAVAQAQAGDRTMAERAYVRAVTFARDARLADDPLVGIAREWIDSALAAQTPTP